MNMNSDRSQDWNGPIDPATGNRLIEGDKFRYYYVFVKEKPASHSKIHLYARTKAAVGSTGERLASAFLSDLDRYNDRF